MNLDIEELPEGVALVQLAGRMDIAGAAAVDLKISAIAGARRRVVINLSQVTFLASMGIRTLALAARTIASKNGKVACFGANEEVAQVLQTAGMTKFLPLSADQGAALAVVLA